MYMGTPFPSPPSSFYIVVAIQSSFSFSSLLGSYGSWYTKGVIFQQLHATRLIYSSIHIVCDSYVSKTLLYYTYSCGHVSIFWKLHQLFSRWGDKWPWQILYKGDINYEKCHLLIFLPIVGIAEPCNRPGITKHYSSQSITNSTNPLITPYHTKLPLQSIHTLITLSLSYMGQLHWKLKERGVK
jgi:hypothetical protein